MRTRTLATSLVLASTLAACSTFGLDAQPTPSRTPTPPPDPAPAGVAVQSACAIGASDQPVEPADGLSATTVAALLFPCAQSAIVTRGSAAADRLVTVAAAGLAARLGLPLFLDEAEAEASGLDLVVLPDEATVLAPTPTPSPEQHPIPSSEASPARLAKGAARVVDGSAPVAMATALAARTNDRRVVLLDDETDLAAGLRIVARDGGILLPMPRDARVLSALTDDGFELVTTRPGGIGVPSPPAGPGSSPSPISIPAVADPGHAVAGTDLWLVGEDVSGEPTWLEVAAAVGREQRLAMVPGDPRTDDELHRLLDDLDGGLGTVRRDTSSTTWEQWQLETVLAGAELPAGGFVVFPGRRFVAMYGHPRFGGLGVLGEQGPSAAVERARQIAAPYEAGGLPVVPAFDIITTLASSGPTPDGDYSAPLDLETLRPWIDAATDAGFYVTLDFQPGRSSYMDQVPRYEEFLLLPNVGVALDPEWRLGPNQVHLRQIGSVSATEINEVAAYLADLVREHRLPQKLLVIHQFKLSMIRDRDLLEHPPELAVLIHMDGQGPIGTKDETYRAITAGFTDRVWWGWKNFYDEDSPTPSPEHTMSREPSPLFVSYQ